MQPTWGPKVFWFVVFLLIVAGVFAYFYEPAPELEHLGSVGVVENVLHVSPKLTGFELQVGGKDTEPTEWSGRIALGSGKVVQINPIGRVANWSTQGNRFNFNTQRGEKSIEPVVLQIVCEADPGDSVTLTLKEESQTIPLADAALGK